MEEATELLHSYAEESHRVRGLLQKMMLDHEATCENLKATQARCSELLDVGREYRAVARQVVEAHRLHPSAATVALAELVERDPANYPDRSADQPAFNRGEVFALKQLEGQLRNAPTLEAAQDMFEAAIQDKMSRCQP